MRRAPWSSILFIVNYSYARVMLYAKVLIETEHEETSLLCQIFVIGSISIEGARAPWVIPVATSMILRYDRALNSFDKKSI